MLSVPAADALADISRDQADDDSILIAVPAARLLLGDLPALHPALAQGLKILAELGARTQSDDPCRFTDPAGHRRLVYTPFVLHLHLAAFAKCYEQLPPPLWAVCEDALPRAVELARPAGHGAGARTRDDDLAPELWQALCLAQFARLTSRDVELELADAIVHDALTQPPAVIADAPHPLRLHHRDESIETWTYRELTSLHALANLALLRRNRQWSVRVSRVARYHLDHTQPDHATTEPWGVFAFLWSPETRPFAQQQLHDAAARHRGRLSPLPAMLLADAAHALSQFD